METGHQGYAALSQQSRRPRRWWERVPEPLQLVALRTWSALPHVARAPFIPLGRWINPGQSVSAEVVAGPESVPGVRALRAEGFSPLEEHTGAVWVARFWPEADRRSVAETRPGWLDAETDGRLWLVRSPWPSLTLDEALNVLWSWAERDRPEPIEADAYEQRVAEALTWDDTAAGEWLRRAPE